MVPHKRKASDGDSAGAAGKRKAKSGKSAEEEHFSEPADGPRNAVFATAELLEQILMLVPPITVFGVQRVCRQFRDILATSAALQGKLCLRAPQSSADEVWTLVRTKDNDLGWPSARKVVRISDVDALPEGATRTFKHNEPPRCHLVRHCSPLFERHAAQTDRQDQIASPMAFLVSRVDSLGLTFESTDIACKRATVWLPWSIATKPITTGTVYLCATRTDQSNGFTLGMLLAAALHHSDDVEDDLYYHNWQLEDGFDNWAESTDPLVRLIEKLQIETGERAYMESLQVDTMDVIQPSDAERDMVGDA
ncbi:hypothetical protein LTR10_006150 [Elasticomyces elasticus]|nr:hypothetical protein LTR10_006150 [Elasticomyces elasticus]KAK4966799.1 hypothetical protein LTR42_011111 [Elasticomyces elasticus]